jgi:hypothetical protein
MLIPQSTCAATYFIAACFKKMCKLCEDGEIIAPKIIDICKILSDVLKNSVSVGVT